MKDNFPAWYQKEREEAIKHLKEAKVAKYGVDIPLERYIGQSPSLRKRKKIENLKELKKSVQVRLESVGERVDERYRSASHLQEDDSTVYLKGVEGLLPEGVVIMDTDEAIKRFSWLRDYYFKIMPKRLNKYSTFVNAYSKGGIFVWVKEGVKVNLPLQACFYLKSSNYVQTPHSFIIAEPYSQIHLLSGCTTDKECRNSAHIAVTEIYVKEGAEVTWTMIHNWGEGYHIRPNVGIKVERKGRYISNYLLTSEVESIQAYPTAVLEEDARAVFNTMLFCKGRSKIDIGSAIYFKGKNSKGEIRTRALVLDSAQCFMRGNLQGTSRCSGHLECKGLILSKSAQASAYPHLSASEEAELTHEASIGKIRAEELNYLMSRGFSKEEATSLLVRGFINLDIPALPSVVENYIKKVIEMSAKGSI